MIEKIQLGVDDPLMTTKEAAKLLNYSPLTLARWRLTGYGPTYIKVGPNSVRYSKRSIDEFLHRNCRNSTSSALGARQ